MSAVRTVLGFSGLARSAAVKRASFSDLDPRESAIVQGGDAAAAVVVGAHVVAASASERFDGVKHSSALPANLVDWCLRRAGVTASQLDCVAHAFDYRPHEDHYSSLSAYYGGLYREALAPSVNRAVAEQALAEELGDRFVPVAHHRAHAASAYYPSPFDDALVLVSDGLGERESASVFVATRDGLELVRSIPAGSSIGLLYGMFTLYLGFWFADGEYKVMGLAPYGDPDRYFATIMDRCVDLRADGTYGIPILLENVSDLDKETYRASLRRLEGILGPARTPESPIEQRHADVAAGVQAVLQHVQLALLRRFRAETGLRRLCVAGGVGLNCSVNGAVLRSRMFDDVFVQPAAGDDGAAVGAALAVAAERGTTRFAPMQTALGPEYTPEECAQALATRPDLYVEWHDSEQGVVVATADLLATGAVVGWFQGRMEFGPRALGNRSILADPRDAAMRERINELVKKREAFRPFAPAVPEELAADWFEIDPDQVHCFRNMLFVAYLRDDRAGLLPAVTHVDGTARVQTVPRARDPRFWRLLHEFGLRSGVPILLNTSFNVRGQPIVRRPEQALATFDDAGLDALVLGDAVVRRKGTVEQ